MRSRVLAWLGVLGAVSSVGGCGEPGTGPVPEEELEMRLAVLFCDGLANCCDAAKLPISVADCIAAQVVPGRRPRRPPTVAYDASAAGECLDVMAAHAHCGRSDVQGLSACDRVWRGTVPLGKPCNSSRECQPSPFEVVSCQQNKCAAVPRVSHGEAGDACAFTCPTGTVCNGAAQIAIDEEGVESTLSTCFMDEGLYCKAGTCTPLGKVGAPCSSAESCETTAYCDLGSGACRAREANGAPCTRGDECESGNCVAVPSGVGSGDGLRRCAADEIPDAAECLSYRDSSPPPNGL